MKFLPDERMIPFVWAASLSILLGVSGGFLHWLYPVSGSAEGYISVNVAIYILMHVFVFAAGFVVRARSWFWGIAIMTSQSLVSLLIYYGSEISGFVIIANNFFLCIPLVLAGFFGAWLAKAISNRKKAIVVVCSVALIAAEVLIWNLLRIDTCLDRGGRWDYQSSNCEYE